MSQETPEVEPVSTPDPKASQHLTNFWNPLSKNAKIAIGVVVALLVIIIATSGGNTPNPTPTTPIDTTPTTISPSAQWNAWKANITPVINQTQTDYTQTEADLTNSDQAASTQDFATLSQDATNIAGLANSPDTDVNNDLLNLASSLHEIASTGIAALSNGDLSSFQTALVNYTAVLSKLSSDLSVANSTYA
jgi:hypothetical protein